MATVPAAHEGDILDMEYVATPVPAAQSAIETTPMSLIRIAVEQNADMAKLEKLMELQLRWEANEARKAYVKAMAAFKENAPQILKNKHVRFQTSKGVTEYDHATLDEVCEKIVAGLGRHGISHKWNTSQPNGKIRVACFLTHAQGHTEEGAALESGPDDSGGKNSIQAISSTITYLERITLLAATGLAAKDMDTDGRTADEGSQTVKLDNLSERLEWIANSRNRDELMNISRKAYNDAQALQDKDSMREIVAARDKRKKELGLD